MTQRQLNKIMVIGTIVLSVVLFIYKLLTNYFKEDEFMVTFIAQMVKDAREVSLEKGQAKYRAYFVRKSAKRLYGCYQEDVDTVLTTDGYEDCIVAE